MKDILGNELNIGDMVVCTTSKYEELSIGRITRFTPKKAEVKMKLGLSLLAKKASIIEDKLNNFVEND